MAEATNLTTTITSDEYAYLLYRIGQADRLAEAVAADWLESAGFSFNKPSDATLKALRKYDGALFYETEEKVKEAEEKNEEASREAHDVLEKTPVLPYPYHTQDDNPPLVEVGDRPDLEPKITCDSGNN